MMCATVIYPNQQDAKFDFEYYMKKHIPMVEKLLNTTIEVMRGLSSPSGPPVPFVCTARIKINSAQEHSAAMATHGAQILGDIPNYTNIQPLVQIDELVEAARPLSER
jgi:uncharacterized protein (TIGR02118 family)